MSCPFQLRVVRAVGFSILVALLSQWQPLVAATSIRRETPLGGEAIVVSSAGKLFTRSHPLHEAEGCAKLKNRGSFFSVAIKVGNKPGKSFDVVADTGSNAVIVASCQCAVTGTCGPKDPCFASSDSETLHVNRTADGKVPIVVMAFGSGEIEAEVGSDKVVVGDLEAEMNDELLLMVDRALSIKGPFEGILGLGIPQTSAEKGWTGKHHWTAGVHHKNSTRSFQMRSFLEAASISRFSMCFQDSGDGALRLNTPQLTEPLGSIGVAHWGLDFRGVSVGTASMAADAKFCTANEMKQGQETPCGAIPDSGTTLMMGPQEHVEILYEEICDSWLRCSKAFAVGQGAASKAKLVEELLATCASWMTSEEEALEELPDLHFHLRGKPSRHGADGPQTTITFKGRDYVEMGIVGIADDMGVANRTTLSQEPMSDYLKRQVPRQSSDPKQGILVCMPAIGALNYSTQTNGPVWILGTPLFYAFQVSYDLASRPPAIQIARAPCASCDAGDSNFGPVNSGKIHHQDFVEAQVNPSSNNMAVPRPPRRIRAKARFPSQQLSGPL